MITVRFFVAVIALGLVMTGREWGSAALWVGSIPEVSHGAYGYNYYDPAMFFISYWNASDESTKKAAVQKIETQYRASVLYFIMRDVDEDKDAMSADIASLFLAADHGSENFAVALFGALDGNKKRPQTILQFLNGECSLKYVDGRTEHCLDEYAFMRGIACGNLQILGHNKLASIGKRCGEKLKKDLYGGEYPLLYAIKEKQLASVEWLLKNGADQKIADHKGNTPLHVAATLTGVKFDIIKGIIELLVRRGADINAKNGDSLTALGCAGSLEIRGLLEQLKKSGVKKLTTYENYFYKRVAIFINDASCRKGDAIVIDCKAALAQQASFLIVASPVICQIDSNDRIGWTLYENQTAVDFYLCVPPTIKISKPDELVAFGFNGKLKVSGSPYMSHAPFSSNSFFDKQSGLFADQTGPWNIFIDGHGGADNNGRQLVVGMPIDIFQNFLTFLNTEINTNFLFYSTCFGGGENLITPYLSKQENKFVDQRIKFVVAEAATTDEAVLATPGSPYEPTVDFIDFFDRLEGMAKKNMADNKADNKKEYSWRSALEAAVPKEASRLATETPLIRFPGAGVFQAAQIDKRVFTLTHNRLMAAVLEGEPIVVDKDQAVLLLYPAIIPQEIKLENKDTVIISMNPEGACHYFEKITLSDAYEYYGNYLWPKHGTQKRTIFAKEVSSSQGPQVTLENAILYWEKENGHRKSGFLCKNSNTEWKGKYMWGDYSTSIVDVGEFQYTAKAMALLDTYAQGSPKLVDSKGNILATWQVNPATLVAFIKNRCFGVKPETSQQAAVEEIKQKYFAEIEPKYKALGFMKASAYRKKMFDEAFALRDEELTKRVDSLKQEDNIAGQIAKLEEQGLLRTVLGKKIKDANTKNKEEVVKKYQDLLAKLPDYSPPKPKGPVDLLSEKFASLALSLQGFAKKLGEVAAS